MNNGDTLEAVWGVLRWVLLVLATGFVAYVGRFGAQWLIERWRARHRPSADSDPPRDEGADTETWAKVEKKRAKAWAKAEKKRRQERE